MIKENKISKYLLYAIGEISLVMIGILLALQVNNWNEKRKITEQEQFILQKLKVDLSLDVINISNEIKNIEVNITELTFCLDAILGKNNPSHADFIRNLNSLLTIISFNQNQSTFNNIVSSGQIAYIKNPSLTDSITKYYNYNYKTWDTALKDYTRNIMAPFMLNFDHIPEVIIDNGLNPEDFTKIDFKLSIIPPKTIDDYRKEIFILNILRQKIYNMEGQKSNYKELKIYMQQLLQQLDKELNRL